MRTPLLRAVALALVVGLLGGCAGSGVLGILDGAQALDEAQRRYTRFMRWTEFARASEYVDPAEREAFLVRAGKLADVRFTDYELLSREGSAGNGESTVRVRYRAYRLSSASEITFEERQTWYRDEASRAWLVRSVLEERGALAAGPRS